MDPQVTLDELVSLIRQSEDKAESLFLWFHRGGFAPDGMLPDRHELRRRMLAICSDLDRLSTSLSSLRGGQ